MKVIETKARELGATKVITAHNLDDEVQTILINYIRWDIERLSGLRGRREEFVLRITPLRGAPENEVALYALVAGIPISTIHCPYIEFWSSSWFSSYGCRRTFILWKSGCRPWRYGNYNNRSNNSRF